MHKHNRHEHAGRDLRCCPEFAGQVRGFLEPRILLALAHNPAHGYELLERLTSGEVLNADPGFLYRTLRKLEDEGVVQSSWNTEGSGPARRVYAITDLGWERLHAWAVHLRGTRARLDRFLTDYEALKDREGGENNARIPQPR